MSINQIVGYVKCPRNRGLIATLCPSVRYERCGRVAAKRYDGHLPMAFPAMARCALLEMIQVFTQLHSATVDPQHFDEKSFVDIY